MNSNIKFTDHEIKRLRLLLNYSLEAVEYWYDSCDSDEKLILENNYFSSEIKYFIQKINKHTNNSSEIAP